MKGSSLTPAPKALLAVVVMPLPIFVAFNYSFIKNKGPFVRHTPEELSVIAWTFEF